MIHLMLQANRFDPGKTTQNQLSILVAPPYRYLGETHDIGRVVRETHTAFSAHDLSLVSHEGGINQDFTLLMGFAVGDIHHNDPPAVTDLRGRDPNSARLGTQGLDQVLEKPLNGFL